MSKIESLKVRLKKLAIQRSQPFCYSDYIECPSGRCPKCGSDDLMRSMRGVGVEWGTDWIVEHLLETEFSPVDLEKAFEESVTEIYPESVQVGWMNFDTVTTMKEHDPVSWRMARDEWADAEESEGRLFSLDGSTYYWTHEIESLLDQAESEPSAA
ncbi:MAG: hypothetical protein JST16_01820 [Bdellovibrionales bacterium]|nr:hypothetical protein [Bdellovibrionales bacterium]